MNGTAVALVSSADIPSIPSFALTAGANTVQFTNTFTSQGSTSIPDPTAGGWHFNGKAVLAATKTS